MKLKRLLCWGMAMALACSSLPQGTVLAEEVSSQEEVADVKLQYAELEDGTLEVTFRYQLSDWTFLYLLSFGEYVEIIEPVEARMLLKEKAQKILAL